VNTVGRDVPVRRAISAFDGGDSPGHPGGFLLHRRLPACAAARAGL